MGMVELFVPMTVIIVFAVIVGLITRLIATGMHHKTIREALKTDPGSVPLLVDRLSLAQPWADAMLGWVFIALAVGIATLALISPDDGNRPEMLRAAIVPLIIGATVLLFVRTRKPPSAVVQPGG